MPPATSFSDSSSSFFLLFIVATCSVLSSCTAVDLKGRAPGDTIFSKCQNITESILGQNLVIPNACLSITEGLKCDADIKLVVDGQTIVDRSLSLQLTDQVCGQRMIALPGGLQANCTVCVQVNDDPNTPMNQCLVVKPVCTVSGIVSPIDLPPTSVGCFSAQSLIDCAKEKCPNSCSGHGTCNNGKCHCNTNWFGSDCSVSTQLFEQCVQVDQLSGNVCVRLAFSDCEINLNAVLQYSVLEVSLYEKSYSIVQFKEAFRTAICFSQSECSACLKWDNLVVNTTQFSGDGVLSLGCGAQELLNYPLGSFDDDQIGPQCFASCPHLCSGHGFCKNGFCECEGLYSGNDCSILAGQCPNGCSGHGYCRQDHVCQCNPDYQGSDCSQPAHSISDGPEKSTSSKHGSGGLIVGFIMVSLVLFALLAGAAAFFYYKKRQNKAPTFDRFDLLEEEQELE